MIPMGTTPHVLSCVIVPRDAVDGPHDERKPPAAHAAPRERHAHESRRGFLAVPRASGVRVLALQTGCGARTLGLVEDHLADADGLRSHLDALVLAGELEALLERELAGGVSFSSSSAVDERMLVSFFSLVMFTSMSSARVFSPTTMPS